SCRRQHTRFSRDWSSDVCSSDLEKKPVEKKAVNKPVKKAEKSDSAAEKKAESTGEKKTEPKVEKKAEPKPEKKVEPKETAPAPAEPVDAVVPDTHEKPIPSHTTIGMIEPRDNPLPKPSPVP